MLPTNSPSQIFSVISDATERDELGVSFHDVLKAGELRFADPVAHDVDNL